MSAAAPVGVVVMAYGTPESPADVAAFYTDVRRGRPPTDEQLADLERRYRAIGGVSPLASRTTAQVEALAAALEARAPGAYRVHYGSKHAAPKIEDAVDAAASDGVGSIVGLVLAPHYSALSVGEYVERASARAATLGLASRFVESWHDEPVLIELLAGRVLDALEGLGASRPVPPQRVEVVVSAHSLPSRILETGDPYPDQLDETAALVASAADLSARGINWRTGWQSAGRTAEPWIGPDILELLPALANDGVTDVVVCPAGFTSDHLEVLYDLDVDAAALARGLGIGFGRTASLNDDPALAQALARRIMVLAGRRTRGILG